MFSDDLKVDKITPIDKSEDEDQLTITSLFSVLPTVARGFEKILHGQLYEYFMTNKLLGHQQLGFLIRSLHPTALAL